MVTNHPRVFFHFSSIHPNRDMVPCFWLQEESNDLRVALVGQGRRIEVLKLP